MTKRIALTGAHGVGKTTLAETAVQTLRAKGVAVSLTPEVPRVICDLAKDPVFFRRGNNTALKQALLLYGQTQIEYQKSQQGSSILVCDRALLDHWAYTKHFFSEEFKNDGVLDLYEHFISDYCRSYNRLFYIPIEFPPLDDGTRESDEAFQRSIDEIILQFLSDNHLPYSTVTGSVEQRCQQIIGELESGTEVNGDV